MKIIFNQNQLLNSDNQISGVLFQFSNTNKYGYRVEAVSDQFWQDLENNAPVNINHNGNSVGFISSYQVLKNKVVVYLNLNNDYQEKVKNGEFSHLSWEGQATDLRTGKDLTLETLLNTKDRYTNPIPARLVKLNGVALTNNPSHLEAQLDKLINNYNNKNINLKKSMLTPKQLKTAYKDFDYIQKMSDNELKNNYFELIEPFGEEEITPESLKKVVEFLENEDKKLKEAEEKEQKDKEEAEKKDETESLQNSLKNLSKHGKLLTQEENTEKWVKNQREKQLENTDKSERLISKIAEQLENSFNTGVGSPNLAQPEIVEYTSMNNFLNLFTDYKVDPKQMPIEEYSPANAPSRNSYAEGSPDSAADFVSIYENEIFPKREVKWTMNITKQKLNSGALTYEKIARIMLNTLSEWRTYYALYGTTDIEGIAGNASITPTTAEATYTNADYVKAMKDKSEGVIPADGGEFHFVISLKQYFKHLMLMMTETGKTLSDAELLAISKFKAGQLYLPVALFGGLKGIALSDRIIATSANKSTMFYGNMKKLITRDQVAPYIRSIAIGSTMDLTATTDAFDAVVGAPQQVGYMTGVDVQ